MEPAPLSVKDFRCGALMLSKIFAQNHPCFSPIKKTPQRLPRGSMLGFVILIS